MENVILNLPCQVNRIFYQDKGFTVCKCKVKRSAGFTIPEKAITDYDMVSNNDFFTAAGHADVYEGQHIQISGTWTQDKRNPDRLQLKITDVQSCRDDGRETIVEFLCSGVIKGIGAKLADDVFEAFGSRTLHVLQNEPEQLTQVKGIKRAKLKMITTSYEQNKDIVGLVYFLCKSGFTYNAVLRIHKELGNDAAAILKANPYRLCDVRGLGFKDADRLALSINYDPDSIERMKGAFAYALKESESSGGHLFLTRSQLTARACELMNSGKHIETPVAEETVSRAIDTFDVATGMDKNIFLFRKDSDLPTALNFSEDIIYRNRNYVYEKTAARKLAELISASSTETDDVFAYDELIQQVEDEMDIELDPIQAEAVKMALSHNVSVITGGPGTGKTTLLKVFVGCLQKQLGGDVEIRLAAPTGRAARRMEEQIGLHASTIHSLLGLTKDAYTDFSHPEFADFIECDCLIVDESSMIDGRLMAELMYRCHTDMKLLFVGDIDQLPSVGAGNVMRQLLNLKSLPHTKLTKIFRQGNMSIIPINAAKVNAGDTDLVVNRSKTFLYESFKSQEEALKRIIALEQAAIEKGVVGKTQILCPVKKGTCGINNINKVLQDVVNPRSPEKNETMIGTVNFRVGDKVMQTVNIEGASNGDIGYITAITNGDDPAFAQISVDYGGQFPVVYSYNEAKDLTHANAITIHKSQGGEFDAVIIPMFSDAFTLAQRNLLYTAITRAKKQVIIIGESWMVNKAIQTEDTSKRNTLLTAMTNFILAGKELP